MTTSEFTTIMKKLEEEYENLITRKNIPEPRYNGIYTRYRYPVVTAEHAPSLAV
jgi:4-O-beta-D-mannosyl-D-glucose phosphorylase